ncbi:unnamed protein product, partial [Staurois parvus]
QFPHQSVPLHQVSPSEYPPPPPLHQFPHQSVPLHQVSPSEYPLTSVVPIRVPPYISVPIRVPPLTSGVPIRVPPLTSVSPSECPLTSGVPIRVPSYIRIPSECPLTSEWFVDQWMRSQRPGGAQLKSGEGGPKPTPAPP